MMSTNPAAIMLSDKDVFEAAAVVFACTKVICVDFKPLMLQQIFKFGLPARIKVSFIDVM